MNALTKKIVDDAIREHPSQAKRGGWALESIIEREHWNYLVGSVGVEKKERALRLWRACHPEHFEDGYLMTYNAQVYDVEIWLSGIAVRAMEREIACRPELQLSDDWRDYARMMAEPQMSLL